MEAAFRVERYRPPNTALTMIAGTVILLGIMIISSRARQRPETKRHDAETRGIAAGGDLGLREVAGTIEGPKLIRAVEPRTYEPGGRERAQATVPRADLAIELGAQKEMGSCRTDFAQAPQNGSLSWFELSQKHWRRNLEGLNKLTRSQSVQEFTAIRSELVREGLQQMAEDSRIMVETSMRVVDDAGKALSNYAQVSRSNVH